MNAAAQRFGYGRRALRWLIPLLLIGRGLAAGSFAEPGAGLLLTQVQVDSQGIFADQLFATNAATALPHIRLADAPGFGRSLVLTRAQVQSLFAPVLPEVATNLSGRTERVRVVRRARVLDETEIKSLITVALQRQHVRERGELELRLTRPWLTISVPDEPIEVRILDLPTLGVTANFIVRFELRAAQEALGPWQLACQARIWGPVWVTTTPLQRGQMLGRNDLVQERRDLLSVRDTLAVMPSDDLALELTDNVAVGSPLLQRCVRLRPVVHRGDLVEALIREGALTISLKVEVLEEGACGQAVRVRNPYTKRELRGKVQNEQTILVNL